jgi:hypothetical protein
MEDGLGLGLGLLSQREVEKRKIEREKERSLKRLVLELCALGGMVLFLVGLVFVCSSGEGGMKMGVMMQYPPIRRKG